MKETILQMKLTNGRHIDVPLDWLRMVLDAIEQAPDHELIAKLDNDRDDWCSRVAGAELTRRKEVAVAVFRAKEDAARITPEHAGPGKDGRDPGRYR